MVCKGERIYWVAEEQFLAMLSGWCSAPRMALPRTCEWPPDAKVVRCFYDDRRGAFALCVRSGAFESIIGPTPETDHLLSFQTETVALDVAEPHRGKYVQSTESGVTIHYAAHCAAPPVCGDNATGAHVTSRLSVFFGSPHRCSRCEAELTRQVGEKPDTDYRNRIICEDEIEAAKLRAEGRQR